MDVTSIIRDSLLELLQPLCLEHEVVCDKFVTTRADDCLQIFKKRSVKVGSQSWTNKLTIVLIVLNHQSIFVEPGVIWNKSLACETYELADPLCFELVCSRVVEIMNTPQGKE